MQIWCVYLLCRLFLVYLLCVHLLGIGTSEIVCAMQTGTQGNWNVVALVE